MKPLYRILALGALIYGGRPTAQAQHWAPFRPGAIHSFRTSVGDTVFTLRLDSAYVSAANDSVYQFNRILRQRSGREVFVRSANSFFGARVLVRPGRREFELLNAAEGAQPAQALLLKPYAAVGNSWPAAVGSPVTVTLTAKTLQLVAGQSDSVATFTLSDGRSLLLSRRYGLVQAPKWLRAGAGSQTLRLEQLPMQLVHSAYAPARVFDFQVGDEFGYYTENFMNVFGCPSTHLLRRITGRQQTADSLIYTFMEQSVTRRNGSPGCTPAGTTYSTQLNGRLALPLNGGTRNPAQYPGHADALRLLTLEYLPYNGGGTIVALPLTPASPALPCAPGRPLRYLFVSNGPIYIPGIDYGYQTMTYAPGVGQSFFNYYRLTYFRKQQPGGAYQTCGSASSFSALLPARAAAAAARYELFPNPSAGQTTLRLPAPAAAGGSLCLLDATGRRVRAQPLSRGQNEVSIPLGQLPAGLYVVQLHRPGEAPVALRLQHLP